MTGDNEHRTYTDAEMTEIAADLVRKGMYSWSGPSYNPFTQERPRLSALPLFVRVTDHDKVRALFRLVPVYDDTEGVLVDGEKGLRVRLDQIEPGNDAGAGDREARRDRPTVATYDAEERAARHLPLLRVGYDDARGIYRFDMRPLNEKGHRTRSGHLFDVQADRLARVLWMLNENTVTVELLRAALARLSD
ncbi:hypothetical protein BJF89_07360 [Corynebacterium sp. CNJ-954]|uniref:hypothetical protein n=1 Tax=Corynebacterium sp. CNJ-954 TaxID=1904962 RepID=UPI0009618199|nr:hypothetical protein [Corynebacterium sp. CNJ-954]OLT51511.1 hypothetical protein BJF89_07360 [Corynebacterium sp. CNJ-954]